MQQLSKEQAIKFHESALHEQWTHEQVVRFQLFQDKLCMPFSRFHEAISEVLGRDIMTHEFARSDYLREEYLGVRAMPTIEEVMEQIPEDKRMIIEL